MGTERADPDNTFARLARALDRTSSVPVSVQLRGALEYGIASGDIPPGTRLPSVRRLAGHLGVSPVTVNNVYAALQEAGHVHGRVGTGTFVADDGVSHQQAKSLREVERGIAELVRLGQEAGLSRAELTYRVSTASTRQEHVRILMIGTFHDATEAYAEDIRQYLRPGDEIIARTTEQMATQRVEGVGLVVAPRTLRVEAQALFPKLPVVGVTLIPKEATRVALAGIPPLAQVAAVSHFPEFLPAMRAGIMRFAPHVTHVTGAVRDDDDLPSLLARVDVLIHSTGAEDLRSGLNSRQKAIEYRHTPDSNSIETDLLPAIDACRGRTREQEGRAS
ncbi:HTH-type transcriptional repressor YtrA [Jannaschia seosinensis]|uniref:HTH-type transcriptional repressor YtrA n=1 Tax=Jannaschia seosinensis TaxID=313367 RepID=A0A0M7BGE4_9RHOB|nr:GntR family transcriptional regulator [Jannaschia seosinensis]CUH40924.1 HTH-type transcriptional repressor YtrA [Jannaschia seosinensis]